MNLDRVVLAFGGSYILLSVILSVIHSPYWLFFTGFCPLAVILKKVGVRTGHAFN